jgi:hypothetical protein
MRISYLAIEIALAWMSLETDAHAQELTPTEINDAAEANLVQTNAKAEDVRKALATAQRADDQDAVDCVTRAVQKVDPLVGVARGARGKVMDYLAVPDVERALFELRKMDIAAAKVDQFAAEAQKCIDSGDAEDGNTRVDMTSQSLADGDDTSVQVSDDSIVGNDADGTSPFE